MSADYLSLLKAEKTKYIRLNGTDKTDKTPLVSFVSCPQEEINSFSRENALSPEDRFWRWRIHFDDRDMIVSFSPEVTHVEILGLYPDALAAELLPLKGEKPENHPMSRQQESQIQNWLFLIGETDPVTIDDVLAACRRDPDTREYFVGRAN